MAKKSVTKNYIYNVAYQILIIILPIITTPYISRVTDHWYRDVYFVINDEDDAEVTQVDEDYFNDTGERWTE